MRIRQRGFVCAATKCRDGLLGAGAASTSYQRTCRWDSVVLGIRLGWRVFLICCSLIEATARRIILTPSPRPRECRIRLWALKIGIRIKDHWLGSAADLRECLASDAAIANQVADVADLAQEHPEAAATKAFPEEDVDLLHTRLESQAQRDVVRLLARHEPDIRAVVIDLGRLVRSHPVARLLLPGTQEVLSEDRGAALGDSCAWCHSRERAGK